MPVGILDTALALRELRMLAELSAATLTKDGQIIRADVNGSYNILRKRKPDAFTRVDAKGLAAYVVQPLRLALTV